MSTSPDQRVRLCTVATAGGFVGAKGGVALAAALEHVGGLTHLDLSRTWLVGVGVPWCFLGLGADWCVA